MNSENNRKVCPECDAIYQVSYGWSPFRDSDKFVCSCGYLFEKWSRTTYPIYELVSPRDQDSRT